MRMYSDIHMHMQHNSEPSPSEPHSEFLEEVSRLWPLAKGSLSEVSKPCTQKGCKACAEGRGHPATIYTYRQGGKLKCMHVRPRFVPQMRKAIANCHQLEEILTRLGRETLVRLREEDS